MSNTFDIRYDRRVSEQFLQYFAPDGLLSSLPAYAKSGLFPLDLRFRRAATSGAEHATLYVGLTSVLDVHHTKVGSFKLKAHTTHQKNGGFDPAWSSSMTVDQLALVWPAVELYLDRIIPIAAESHGRKEGAVQAAVSSFRSVGRVVLDREVTPSFKDKAFKKEFMSACQKPILEALQNADLGFSKVPTKLGNECDAIAVDDGGRVLAVEVKPLGVGSIAYVVAQATMYARILQGWLDAAASEGDRPVDVLRGMLDQRNAVRLAPQMELPDVLSPKVVPVVALQRGASSEMIRRMCVVRDVLKEIDTGVAEAEIYEISLTGEWIPLDESRLPDGRPRARRNYARESNLLGQRWKQSSAVLPAEAKAPGEVRARGGAMVEVDYALPRAWATHNLLPEVREPALALFEQHQIAWHQSIDGGPTNHLRSSQVQCVNALGQMMSDPERIKLAFGDVLDIAEIRDFGEIDAAEKGRYLTFEFVGKGDYFGEGVTRGSQSTSVDAAFAYTTPDGRDALALVEWKFTETYRGADPKADAKAPTRLKRYESALRHPASPIDVADIELTDLFHEPVYQLVRQQLLAAELERDAEVKADLITVVHVLSPDNLAYQSSYISPALRRRGATASDVWASLLRTPDRFIGLDPAVFLDPAITSEEYALRYGGGR
ncbi:hypothetical protein EUA93_10820 [Nocardioides oleivorans]|uniref:Uncharacterized protein n=1 Tax=Nocardioides oleivorans TaxID=273676 RepID=A0A4Q2S042_9ACTN|nr:hypothetical protein [Nocardioides oleivorans]RYB94798.1 hypothetical protein EUA93_10820 [Nocardioides oleivorans]